MAVSLSDQFDVDYFDRLLAARDHWWVRGMQEVGASLLDRAAGGPADLRVLDAGCGSGALLPWLRERAGAHRVTAIDFAPAALEFLRRQRLDVDLLRASVTDLPFPDGHFDLIVSMDVLQHLTSDQEKAAAAEMRRVLRPGGRALVRTNAAFGRSGVEERPDWRLYRPGSLRAALESGGLEVERLTHVNALQGLWASLPRRPRPHHHDHDHGHGHGDDHGHGGGDGERAEWGRAGLGIPAPASPLKNRVLLGILRAEARLLARPGRSLPFGHALYAVARRPA